MEIEGNDSFTSSEKIPKKALNKKGINELSANLFSANTGMLDSKAFSVFSNDLEQAESLEDQIRLITVLNKTSPDLIGKFVNCKGMEQVVDLLTKASLKPSEKSELIEKILTFLNKIPLTSETLEKTKVHVIVESIKKNIEMPEDICSKVFRLLAKWKKPIEDWTREHKKDENAPPTQDASTKDSKSETNSEGSNYNRNGGHFNRNAIKRTYDHNRDRPHPRYDGRGPRNFDSQRKPRMYEDRNYRRNDMPSHLMRPRYRNQHEPPHGNYYRRRGNNFYSPPEHRGPRKTLRWAEDSNLCSVKFFKFNDEPTAPGVSEEEVQQIRQKMMNEENGNSSFHSSEDYKHKESLMEGQSMKLIKDSEKEVQEKLDQMKENTIWIRPKKIKLGSDNMYVQTAGKESVELEVQQKRIANKLPAYYLKEYQIPEQPACAEIEEKTNSEEWETMIIPLHNVNERGDPAELMQMFEEIMHHKQEKEVLEKKEGDKIEEENKEENKGKKLDEVKPLKSILKKSREELKKIREEERRQREEERREREFKRKAEEAKLEAMLKSIVEGKMPLENQNDLLEALKNTRNSNNALENIKLLLEVRKMQNPPQIQTNNLPQLVQQPPAIQQQKQQPEAVNSDKKLNHPPGYNHNEVQDQYYGSQPSKRVKLNPEIPNPRQDSQHNSAMDQPETRFWGRSSNMPSIRSFNTQKHSMQPDLEYQSTTNTEETSTENQNKKPFKPLNYKTVPCRLFHSPKGCQFGDDCNYIHDPNYAGRETPNMHKYVRPSHSVNKNFQSNFRSAPHLEEPQKDKMDIEPQNFRANSSVNFSSHNKSQNANYPREEPTNPINKPSLPNKPMRENLNHQPQRQNLHQNSHRPSFDAQETMQRQPNRIQNQQFAPQLHKPQRDISSSVEDFTGSRTNIKDFSRMESNFNRVRPPHPPQQQQKTFSPPQQQQKTFSPPQQPQQRTYNSKHDSFKASMNVPPNPYIVNSQQTEKTAPSIKSFGNNMYKQNNQQNRGPSFDSSDTRRLSNTGNHLSYPQRIQGTEQRSYPSNSQFRQNTSEISGGFGQMRNMHDNRQYQDVRF